MDQGPWGPDHEAARVLSEKNRARIPAPRPYFRRGTLLFGWVRTTGQWQSIGVLRWNLSATGIRLFFRCPLSRTHRIGRCVNFSPDPEAKRDASAGRRGV